MVSEEQLANLFCESTSHILTLSEIRQWCRNKELDDSHLEKCLQDLVDNGSIGRRTISAGQDSVQIASVYWLKKAIQKPVVTPASAIKSVQHQQWRRLPRSGLKRTRPKFVSPLLSQKRSKLGTPSTSSLDTTTSSSVAHDARARLNFAGTESDTGIEKESEEESSSKSLAAEKTDLEQLKQLEEEKRDLEKQLKEREEKLRKLKLVKMYRTKNNLQELERLTSKWREVAQEAAESLLGSSTHEPRPSMAQMLNYLHIDHDLIRYSVQEESFY